MTSVGVTIDTRDPSIDTIPRLQKSWRTTSAVFECCGLSELSFESSLLHTCVYSDEISKGLFAPRGIQENLIVLSTVSHLGSRARHTGGDPRLLSRTDNNVRSCGGF